MDQILKKTKERQEIFAACVEKFKFSNETKERSKEIWNAVKEGRECVPYYYYEDRIGPYCYMLREGKITPLEIVKYERSFGVDGPKTLENHFRHTGSHVGLGIAESFYVEGMYYHEDGKEQEALLYLARCTCMFMRANLNAKEYNKIVKQCRAK